MNIYTDKYLIDNIISGVMITIISIIILVIIRVLVKVKEMQKVVVDLRNTGELDKEKLGLVNKKLIIVISMFGCILLLITISWFLFISSDIIGNAILLFNLIIILMLTIPFCWIFIKNIINNSLLFTIGEKAIAEVTRGRWLSGRSFIHFYYAINYSYTDDEGNKYKGFCEYADKQGRSIYMPIEVSDKDIKFKRSTLPENGDKIEILYLENSPKIVTLFSDSLNQKYNLRRL